MTLHYTIEGLVDRLIGPVEPCGSHDEDQKRLDNLKALCDLNERITEKLCDVATTQHAGRASMKAMSEYAAKHLADEIEGISELINIEESP